MKQHSWYCRGSLVRVAGRVAVAQGTLFSTSETGVTMEAWNSAGRSLTRLTELPNLGKLGS